MKTDVLIIGGSYAGLSAAMSLARALRNVLIIDAGEPANRQSSHAHNFITYDGQSPVEIASRARAQVLAYPTVSLVPDRATAARPTDAGFAVTTQSGTTYQARKLLLATGVTDVLPAIEGLAACWGISVLHCPYCHGYEVAGQQLGILANGHAAIEKVGLLQQWSRQLTLFTNGPATFDSAQTSLLARLNVVVHQAPVAELAHQHGQLHYVRLAGATTFPLDALFVQPAVAHATTLAQQLGCAFTDLNLLQVNDFGQTNVVGVYAAGDNSSPMRAVSIAVGSGTKVGALLNRELTDDELAQ